MDICHSDTGRPSTGPKDPVSALDLRKVAILTPIETGQKTVVS